ncbi:hypothetical protein Vadar_009107 [Vaccinium darrowii]|uniref:Uncharacterized protein n=1 Tax=Vaccinium darrowii TaxID=229202 RepID=A0ACB7YLJ7_9ERIC|nr:hypothetical protein Vadar_009107 [Vaccinium darrowii]
MGMVVKRLRRSVHPVGVRRAAKSTFGRTVTAAELLRNPHLQPYLLRYSNPSPVFLPVKPTNSPKEKPKKSSSRRYSNGSDNGVMVVKVLEDTEPFLPLGENIDKQLTSLSNDSLETKRVEPTSFSANISYQSEESKSGKSSCDLTASSGEKQYNSTSSSQAESSSKDAEIGKESTKDPQPFSNQEVTFAAETSEEEGALLAFHLMELAMSNEDVVIEVQDNSYMTETEKDEMQAMINRASIAISMENPDACTESNESIGDVGEKM